jgi:hypothetical protein
VLGGWVSTSQFIAILMVVGVLLLYPYVNKKERLAPAPA